MVDAVVVLAANVEPWQGVAALGVLASVIGYLFKLYHSRNIETEALLRKQTEEHAQELGRRDTKEAEIRAACEKQQAEIRAACERQLREAAERYAKDLRDEHRDNRAHEDANRQEFVEIMEQVSTQAQKSAEGVTSILDKLHTHLTRSPRSRH